MNIEQLQERLTGSIQDIPGSNVPTANFSPVWINNITRLNAQNLNEKMYKSINTFVQGYGDAVFRGSNSQLSNLLKLLPGYKVSDTSTSEIHNSELIVVEGKEKLSSTNEASGNYQAVFGIGNETVSTVDGQFITGQYNRISDDFILAIGNGNSDTERSNALEVSADGELKTSNISVINGITAPYVKITGSITDETYATNKNYVDTKVDEESERAKAAEDEIRTLAASAFHFKGSKDSYEELPTTGNTQGDVWQVEDKEYAWNGTTWVELGFNIDLSGKQDKFASVSHPDPDGNYTWLDVTTPNLELLNSNRNSVIAMSDEGLFLHSVQNHVQLQVGQQNIKISKSGSVNTSPLLGVSTPVTTADTKLDITEADLPYQAVNKQYVDNNFQTKLVSGTNIKTINGTSLLGGGNLVIEGGGSTISVDSTLSTTSENPVQNKIITNALNNKQDKITQDTSLICKDITLSYSNTPAFTISIPNSITMKISRQGTNLNLDGVETLKASTGIEIGTDSKASLGKSTLKFLNDGPTVNGIISIVSRSDALYLSGTDKNNASFNPQIKGIAAGTADTDAVNVSQLNNKQDSFATLDSTNKKINLDPTEYDTIGNDGSSLTFSSYTTLHATSDVILDAAGGDVVINGDSPSIRSNKYNITWDSTNEAIKITFS